MVVATAWLAFASSFAAAAEPNDAWITTKAKIKLLTADDVSVTDVNVDTQDGRVTLHGKVGSAAEKSRAEKAVRGIEGVREVRNLLQVVPESRKDLVKQADGTIGDRVGKCLAGDSALSGVKVASVNDGVVLLSGEIDTPRDELRAIEAVRSCTSVRRVASEIRTRQR
jgi:osmotically-inducible protein OsmY